MQQAIDLCRHLFYVLEDSHFPQVLGANLKGQQQITAIKCNCEPKWLAYDI